MMRSIIRRTVEGTLPQDFTDDPIVRRRKLALYMYLHFLSYMHTCHANIFKGLHATIQWAKPVDLDHLHSFLDAWNLFPLFRFLGLAAFGTPSAADLEARYSYLSTVSLADRHGLDHQITSLINCFVVKYLYQPPQPNSRVYHVANATHAASIGVSWHQYVHSGAYAFRFKHLLLSLSYRSWLDLFCPEADSTGVPGQGNNEPFWQYEMRRSVMYLDEQTNFAIRVKYPLPLLTSTTHAHVENGAIALASVADTMFLPELWLMLY